MSQTPSFQIDQTSLSDKLPEILQSLPKLTGQPQIAIVGAGISGMMSAVFLRFAGAKVTLFDRQAAAQEASWAGGGIVSPMYPWRYPDAVNHLAAVTQQHLSSLVAWLKAQTGIDPELLTSGMLMLDGEEAQQAEDWCQRFGHPLEVLPPEQRNLLEPRLQTQAELALWMPNIQQVRNPRLMQALKAVLPLLGIQLYENTPIKGWWQEGNHGDVKGLWAEVAGKKQALAFDQVVVTTGAWTSDLVPDANIYPVKGQMLLFEAAEGFLKHMVMEQGRYLIPRKDGRILVGSTVETQADFDKTPTLEAAEALKSFAFSLYPELQMFELETHWAGLRPGKANSIPYICSHPRFENVYVNAGHFRNGVVLSVGAAEQLVQLMTGQVSKAMGDVLI